MSKIDIQDDLDNLGEKVSILAEENRLCKLRDDAGRKLISKLELYLSPSDWLNLYKSMDDIFVKDLMLEWGSNLFPKDFSN